jgi:hypothetical protein
MKTLALALCLLASPAFAEAPASRPVNTTYGIRIDGDSSHEHRIILPILFNCARPWRLPKE